METVALSVGLFGLAMVGMAAGVIFSDRKLQGSCGGTGGKDCVCAIEEQRACKLKALRDAAAAKSAS